MTGKTSIRQKMDARQNFYLFICAPQHGEFGGLGQGG